MSNERVEQSSEGTQLNSPNVPEATSATFPMGEVHDAQYEAESRAFKTYVEHTGQPIPENFKDADSWFASLKEAQANYTRGQQEMAELRRQYAEQGSPPAEEPTPEPEAEATPEPVITEDSPQLRIQEQVKEEAATIEAENIGVTQETYEAWAMEMASTGDISENTRQEIKTKTGFSDKMIDDYITGQKARLRESFSKASSLVGGQEKLQKIFDWASQNLSVEDQQAVNMGLASPSYEVTLRGLSSMYDQAISSQKASEPAQNPKLAQVPDSETGIMPYKTKGEFMAERSDPRFATERKFRDVVEQRMAMTNWNTLPQH